MVKPPVSKEVRLARRFSPRCPIVHSGSCLSFACPRCRFCFGVFQGGCDACLCCGGGSEANVCFSDGKVAVHRCTVDREEHEKIGLKPDVAYRLASGTGGQGEAAGEGVGEVRPAESDVMDDVGRGVVCRQFRVNPSEPKDVSSAWAASAGVPLDNMMMQLF